MSLELEEQYAEGHNHGYDAGYADAQGEAEAEAYRTHLERLGEIPR
jgi:flagellar biosynthesis/type III secretory pathway protein FliH